MLGNGVQRARQAARYPGLQGACTPAALTAAKAPNACTPAEQPSLLPSHTGPHLGGKGGGLGHGRAGRGAQRSGGLLSPVGQPGGLQRARAAQ